MTTWNFTHFTNVTPDVNDGTATNFTVASATQSGATSITESDDVLTFGSGGLGGYRNDNDIADSYSIPFPNGTSAFLIYEGYYNFGGIEGLILHADATGQKYLVTDADPGFTGGENFTTAQSDFCFGPGTAITTPDGPRAVESLRTGDLVTTADGRAVAVAWIGRQTLCRLGPQGRRQAPVRIAAHALGRNMPERDLVITADHALEIDGYLLNAGVLVNGTTIAFVPDHERPVRAVFYHVETADHDLIVAEGVPAETFVDAASRQTFDNYHEYVALRLADRSIPERRQVRVTSQRMLPDHLADLVGLREVA
ncbi:MAG: Hint domain-containing protein [Pseudomonadota bacterium]